MPGTPLTTPRPRVGRPARWLAAALLLPALAACGGGGGGSGSGAASSAAVAAEPVDTPPAEGSGQQPQDKRTQAGGNQGGFSGAGNVSASATGIWPTAHLTLTSSVTSTFTAKVTQVNNCAGGAKSSGSTSVEFTGGTASATVELPGPKPTSEGSKVCFTLTAGGKSQSVQASGGLAVQHDTENGGGQNGGGNENGGQDGGQNGGGGENGGNENGGGSAGTSAGNASAGSGSTP
ncbi:hypothetical protein J5Y04_26145 [Kitasatospora sp. RG8]|uniref:hypothetical protein n=1 Tax=Kitasatospora sp. RG8 TaxID=2820815 RepID=UPI001ADF242C|nr:hypothetical protein [Kitasatospora sp. RG8]MBP0453001.1 hypothetical protein [Kitasatospora sp. RG8]